MTKKTKIIYVECLYLVKFWFKKDLIKFYNLLEFIDILIEFLLIKIIKTKS